MSSNTTNGRLHKRGAVWWIDYWHDGKRYRESSKSKLKRVARDLLRQRQVEIGTGRHIGAVADKVTLGQVLQLVVEDYELKRRRSLKRLKTAQMHVRDFFGEHAKAVAVPHRARSYIRHRREEGAADASILQELASLRRGYKLAVQEGLLATIPFIPRVAVDNVRTSFVGQADLDALLAELPSDLRVVVRFAWITGWRKGEILGLKWSQVDWEAGMMRLGTSKNGRPREVAFRAHPELDAILAERRAITRALDRERLETTGRFEPVRWVFHRQGEEIRSLRGAWNGACRRAGLPMGTVFHDLRRSAIRNFERAGVSRSVATKISGHETESVYRRYAIVDRVSQEEGLRKLARLHENQTPEERDVVPLRAGAGQ